MQHAKHILKPVITSSVSQLMYIEWDFFCKSYGFVYFLHNQNENHPNLPEHFYQFSLRIYTRQILWFFILIFTQKISWLLSRIKCHPVTPFQTIYISHMFSWSLLLLWHYSKHMKTNDALIECMNHNSFKSEMRFCFIIAIKSTI